MYENKGRILEALCETLKLTRYGSDIEKITYLMDADSEEWAVITWEGGDKKKICISADSGIAMIHDVMNHLFD